MVEETLSVIISKWKTKQKKGHRERANNDSSISTAVSTLSHNGKEDSFEWLATLGRYGQPNKTLKSSYKDWKRHNVIVTFIFVPNIYGETTHFQNELHTLIEINPGWINSNRTVRLLTNELNKSTELFMTWSLRGATFVVDWSPHIKCNHSSPINFGARRDLRKKGCRHPAFNT